MTFIDDNGNVLQFDGEFAMTKQSVSFLDFKIKGDVSTNFQVANNSVNRKVLNYNGPQMVDQVAFTKQPFNRIRNGNIIDRGYIVIQSEDADSLDCFYVSGNSNWIQLLQGLISELDYSGTTNGTDYNKLTLASTVTSLTSATEGIIFPLVDWCYGLKKGNNYFFMDNLVDVTNDENKAYLYDFFPCFYVHSLMREIAQQNGFKFDGDLFDDQLFKSLVITPESGTMKREPFKTIILAGANQTSGTSAALYQYTSFTEVQDPLNLFSNSRFTTNQKAGITFTIYGYSTDPNTGDVSLYKNGVSVNTFTLGVDVSPDPYYDIASPGDYFELYFENLSSPPGSTTTFRTNLKIEISEVIKTNDYVNPSNFLPKMLCLDFVKGIINLFGAVVSYNEYSKTISINIIENFSLGDAEDWSDYYISHRSEYTVEQAQNNYIKYSTNNTDASIEKYNALHKLDFGDGNITTGNTLKSESVLAELPFSPSSFNLAANGMFTTNIPLINLVDDGEAVSFSSVASVSATVARFTFSAGPVFFVNEVIRLSNSEGVDLGYFTINAVTSTTIDVYFTFVGTFTGKIRHQKINYQDVGARLLSVKPSTSISDFSDSSSIRLYDESLSATTPSTIPVGVFTKLSTIDQIDQWKGNLAIDNPDSGGFSDPSIKELYFNKISKFLQNPDIRFRMILPESVYKSFDFNRFIYVKSENLTGYLFVYSIVNYVDSNTPVEVNAHLL